MSDVVTVGIVTGGFSLAVAALGAIVTTNVNRDSVDPATGRTIDGTMACKAQGYNQTPGRKVLKLPRASTAGEPGSSASIARFG